ncbi:hypothetical protein S245_043316, partial [Arachis hypogaea]
TFNGKKWEKFNSEKVASLAYARIQGKAALAEISLLLANAKVHQNMYIESVWITGMRLSSRIHQTSVREKDSIYTVKATSGEHCLDNLNDLLRFLRRNDPQTRDVFKQVRKWNKVSKDLIPIIEHYQEDRNLLLNAVKVLVFFTMPIEPGSTDIRQQLKYLWRLKSVVMSSDVCEDHSRIWN